MAIKNDGLTEGEVGQVLDKLGNQATPEEIRDQLDMVAGGGFLGAAKTIAARDMSEILNRKVTPDDAQSTAIAANKFTDQSCNGNTGEAIEFLKDINEKCPAIQDAKLKDLVDSGAAGKLKQLKDADPEQYNALLEKMNANPELIAAMQNNPEQTMAALKQGVPPQEIEIHKPQDTTEKAPSTESSEPATGKTEPDAHTNPAVLAGLTGALSTAWHTVAEDVLPEATIARGDTLIAEIMGHVFEKGSEFIGNAPDMIENVAQNMGIECEASRLDPDTGSEITIAENAPQNTPEQQEVFDPTMDLKA